MAKAVQISITARQSVKRPAKEAGSALADMGNRAAKAGEQILSIERAKAAFEIVKKGAELAAKAFANMAKNSKAMAGELAAIEKASNAAWGALGDVVAQSRAFQEVVDLLTGSDMDGWIRANADAIDSGLSAALKGVIPLAKLAVLSLGGIVQVSALAAEVLPAAWHDAFIGVEVAIGKVHAAMAWTQTFNIFPGAREQARKDLAVIEETTRLAAAQETFSGAALSRAIDNVMAIDGLVESSLGGLNNIRDRLDEAGKARAPRDAPGDPKAAAGAAKAEAARQASIAKAFEEVSEAQIALQEYQAGAEQMALDQLQAALDHQAQVWDGARRQMKAAADSEQRLLDERARHWGGFSGAVDASMNAVISGMEAFGASENAMAVASVAAKVVSATTNAAYEVAQALAAAARYDGFSAATHWASAAQFALVAGGTAAQGVSGGGGGGGGGGAPSAPVEPEPIRAAERSTGGEQITYVQEVHYHGAVIQERQAARDISDLMGGSNRSGVSRFRGGR